MKLSPALTRSLLANAPKLDRVTLSLPPELIAGMSEAEFSKIVIDIAQIHGWRVAHFRAAKVTRGGVEKYETPVAANGKGFPDLVLAKAGRPVIYCELKSESGKVRPEQVEWLELLRLTPSQVFVWRPSQLDEITRILGDDP